MDEQHDAHVTTWQQSHSAYLWNLVRLATQPDQPPRLSRRDGAARKRETAGATKELIMLFRNGIRHPYLTITINLMMRGVILAKDPITALHALLVARPEGRPPEDNEAMEFGIALAIARRVRRGRDKEEAIRHLAAALSQRCPTYARSESTFRRWYERHALAARAELSLQELLSDQGWEQLPTFEQWYSEER